MSSPDLSLLLCRPAFEHALLQECEAGEVRAKIISEGVLLVNGPLPERPLVFERQRLPHARHVEPARLQPLDEAVGRDLCAALRETPGLWAIHAFALPEDAQGLAARAGGLARNLERLVRKLDPALARRFVEPERLAKRGKGVVVQLLAIPEGLWWSCTDRDALSDPEPGGVRRMRFDEGAPSRSFLKVEEALARMGLEPKAGERVIDLGAAPGGWTFAFAKRGCAVLAVDNGPLNIQVEVPGTVTHLEADGLTFEPTSDQLPVDWLLSDMLIAPGPAFGLLRNWTQPGLARRLIVNVKLPQEHPWVALEPIVSFLRGLPHWKMDIRQLYHDRREVTVMGVAVVSPQSGT